MGKANVFLLCFLLLCACSKKQAGEDSALVFNLKETSPEYHAMATDYMKAYVTKKSGLVDTIKIEGNKLYIKFKDSDSGFSYTEFAREAGVEFNQFKLKKLGYKGVVVYCITGKGTVAHAIVQ